jgi:hypothetical protein
VYFVARRFSLPGTLNVLPMGFPGSQECAPTAFWLSGQAISFEQSITFAADLKQSFIFVHEEF